MASVEAPIILQHPQHTATSTWQAYGAVSVSCQSTPPVAPIHIDATWANAVMPFAFHWTVYCSSSSHPASRTTNPQHLAHMGILGSCNLFLPWAQKLVPSCDATISPRSAQPGVPTFHIHRAPIGVLSNGRSRENTTPIPGNVISYKYSQGTKPSSNRRKVMAFQRASRQVAHLKTITLSVQLVRYLP